MIPAGTAKPERIALAHADDLRDVVHRAVACLAQGGLLGLPTESGYVAVVSALKTEAVSRSGEPRPLGGFHVLPLLLKGPDELPDWVPGIEPVGSRLARRCWPGPVTLIARGDPDLGLARRLPPAVRARISTDHAIALCCPSHPLIRDILHLHAGPILQLRTEAARLSTAPFSDQLDVDLILDDGPIASPIEPTVVWLDGSRWDVLQEGWIDRVELARHTRMMILFVCTGNTCRSPMAEAICKVMLAKRLGCRPEELGEKGFVILSAGIAAMDGMPAAGHAIEVARSCGGDLEHHVSRGVAAELLRQADLVLTMTQHHLEALCEEFPEAIPRTRTLHADGDDIPDPVGADRETYRRTAEVIARHVERLLDDLGAGTPQDPRD